MKKTLIALAVAASAVVSGSAMAWSTTGTGSVELSGTIISGVTGNPWEIKVGTGAAHMDVIINKGESVAELPVTLNIPVLGIRVADSTSKKFLGRPGIAPNIDYGTAVDLDSYTGTDGLASLTLDMKDESGTNKIGVLKTKLYTGATAVYKGAGDLVAHRLHLYAADPKHAFFGGLPKAGDVISQDAYAVANAAGTEYVANFTDMGATDNILAWTDFKDPIDYSGFYYAGIKARTPASVNLTSPAGDTQVKWKASLPVTVTFH